MLEKGLLFYKRGRKGTKPMENKRGRKIICIDIGGTAIKSGIMDENRNFLRTDVMDTPRGGDGIMAVSYTHLQRPLRSKRRYVFKKH